MQGKLVWPSFHAIAMATHEVLDKKLRHELSIVQLKSYCEWRELNITPPGSGPEAIYNWTTNTENTER